MKTVRSKREDIGKYSPCPISLADSSLTNCERIGKRRSESADSNGLKARSICPESTLDSCQITTNHFSAEKQVSSGKRANGNTDGRKKVVCPESTFDSASRRDFIRKAALATAAVSLGGALLGSGGVLPRSSAKSDCCVDSPVIYCVPGGIAIRGAVTAYCGSGVGVQGITWSTCRGSAALCGIAYNPRATGYGVRGCAGVNDNHCGIGVGGFGGWGIYGVGSKIGVLAEVCCSNAIPIVAAGYSGHTADLQQWQNDGTPLSVVNNCGWIGIGTSSLSTPLCVNSPQWLVGRFKNSNAASCHSALIQMETSDSTPYQWNIGVAGSSNGLALPDGSFYFEQLTNGSSGGAKIVVNTSGCVGVGTSTPSASLCVSGNGGNIHAGGSIVLKNCLKVDNGNHNTGSGLYPGGLSFGCFPCGSGEGISSNRSTSSGNNQYGLDFFSGRKKRMSLTNCGKLGIGTVTPSSTLCVAGSIGAGGTDFCGTAIQGVVVCGRGVSGQAECGVGVFGSSRLTGVYGCGKGRCGVGVFGSGCCAGVSGQSCCTGVGGFSAKGTGVLGSGGKVGVTGRGYGPTSIPIVAIGADGQTANLQQWENASNSPLSIINKCGWLGLGSSLASTTLQVGGSLSAKTVIASANYKMGATDFAVLASGKIKVTLPPASTATGMIVFVKNKSTDAVTIEAFKNSTETDTIEGDASKALKKQYDSLQLISDGSNEWFVLGNSICASFVS